MNDRPPGMAAGRTTDPRFTGGRLAPRLPADLFAWLSDYNLTPD